MLAAESQQTTRYDSSRRAAGGWREVVRPVEPFLAEVREFLETQIGSFEPEVAEGARYALSSSGKQLRPVLVALSATAVGGLNASHTVGAAIVELVHLATLVHDDVIDEAGIRRKRPTVAARFGNQTAVLLGDCLFAHSLRLAAGFPSPEVCRVVATATKAVCSGEILQTLRKSDLDQPLENYFRIIELKTAELFALACEIGALLGEPKPELRSALRRFGLAFGTAYQVFDDGLDVFGTEETAGKTLGTDLAKGKRTLPFLLAYRHGSAADRRQLSALLAREDDAERASGIRAFFAKCGVASRCRQVVERFLDDARSALRELPPGSETGALVALTDYLGKQTAGLGPT